MPPLAAARLAAGPHGPAAFAFPAGILLTYHAAVALPIARRATRVSLPLVGAFVVGAIAYGGLYTFPAISLAFGGETIVSLGD